MSLKILNAHLKANAIEVAEAINTGQDRDRRLSADKTLEMKQILKSMDTLIMDLNDYFLNIDIRG